MPNSTSRFPGYSGRPMCRARTGGTSRPPALEKLLGRDPVIRSAAYRESGWPSFENAPTYTADQIAAERSTDLATAARGFTAVHRFHRRQNNLSFSK
jgi:hypothetical protein